MINKINNINNMNNKINNNERTESEALTKTTTLESNRLLSERNPSELSLSLSNLNLNFPILGPGSFVNEQNNNLFNNNLNLYPNNNFFSSNNSGQLEQTNTIFSHSSGSNENQPNIYNTSSGNNSRNDLEFILSNSFQSNLNLFEANPSIEQRPPDKKLELIVDIKKVICLEDRRTTIMVKNIPNKFTRDLLIKTIDKNFKSTYDLFILPTDVNRYKNFGYAFLNFTCSYHIPYFYFLFNGKKWGSTNSQKICEITYSKIQGRNNLLAHYSNKIIFRNDDVKKYDAEQKFIIPNEYRQIFNKAFPNYKVEEFKYYFLTKMPIKY
jgi:hypothetical protein